PASGEVRKVDEELQEAVMALVGEYPRFMKALEFHKALMGIWTVIGRLNKYIDSMAPWVLAKSDRPRLETVLFHLTESIKIVSVLVWPFMPQSAENIQHALGLPKSGRELTTGTAQREEKGEETEGRKGSDLF
ncbi:MAG: hypothetical protein JRJ82_20590, partial [Deltaproteobacteria bacterium]|nr:hypothetical protein [Deltaproteobacteria bacterium]